MMKTSNVTIVVHSIKVSNLIQIKCKSFGDLVQMCMIRAVIDLNT